MSMKKTSNGMGTWKCNTHPFKWRDGRFAGKKPSRTASKLGSARVVKPPVTGWPGGDPVHNGWKPGG